MRLRRLWRDAQGWTIGALGLAALLLGWFGLRDYAAVVGGNTDFWDLLYADILLFVFGGGAYRDPSAMNPALQVARFLAPAVASVALIRAFAPRFRDYLQLLRLRVSRGHVVVCGLGNKGYLLATRLRERGYRVVAIEQAETNERIGSCRSAGVVVLVGDATDVATLQRAGVRRAGYVVATCGDEGVNAEIAVGSHRLTAKRRQPPLICMVHVTDPHLCSLLRARYLAVPDPLPFRLDFFNTFERGAQALLLRHPAFGDDDEPGLSPHLLIVGLGRLGASVVVQAARNWQAGNHAPDTRLRFSVVDRNAEQKVLGLLLRNPEVGEISEIVPINIDVHAPEFERCEVFDEHDGEPITAAYVCFDDDARSMETALVLHNHLRGREVPIVMRAVTELGLPALLGTHGAAEFEDLHAFALLDRTCDPDLVLGGTYEILARALHDIFVDDQESAGWRYGADFDEDEQTSPSLATWNALDEEFRASDRDQAAHVAVKLNAVGCALEEFSGWFDEPFSFTADEVELLAELEHERFDSDRRRHGWTLGSKDLERKRSPYLVRWPDLPEDVREYDRVFVRSLPTVLAKLGYRIVRVASRSRTQT